MVRELEEERSQRIAIVVDTLADVVDGHSTLDDSCIVAASVARVAFSDEHGVRTIAVSAGGSVDTADDVDEGPLRRRLAAVEPDGRPMADLVERGFDALRDVDVAVLVFPTWRTNGDGALVRVIEALVAAHTAVVAVPVEVPEESTRGLKMQTHEVDAFVAALRLSGADVYPWRAGVPLDDVFGREPAGRP
jgi:uncharacterized protein (DUF58 family)